MDALHDNVSESIKADDDNDLIADEVENFLKPFVKGKSACSWIDVVQSGERDLKRELDGRTQMRRFSQKLDFMHAVSKSQDSLYLQPWFTQLALSKSMIPRFQPAFTPGSWHVAASFPFLRKAM